MKCSFEEETKLPDGSFRHTECFRKAEILVVNDPCYGLCFRCAYHKLQAELAKHRWIPVSERLPEKSGEYLVLPYIKHCPSLWYQGGWYWYDEVDDAVSETIGHYGEEPIPEVTHWKPIILPKGS